MKLIDTNDEYRDMAKILSLMESDMVGARKVVKQCDFKGLHCNLIKNAIIYCDYEDDPWCGLLYELREVCDMGYRDVLMTALQLCNEWDALVLEARDKKSGGKKTLDNPLREGNVRYCQHVEPECPLEKTSTLDGEKDSYWAYVTE